MSHPLLGQRCDRVRKGSNSRDGIKRCPESALDESPSGELPELGSVRGVPWFPKRSSDASPTFVLDGKKFFSRKFMTLDLLEMTLEPRSFSCFVWTGILEALMSETNKCLAKKVKRNIDVGHPLSDAEACLKRKPMTKSKSAFNFDYTV
ncbi:hypothetical protein OUZ56_004974 [Daphnia magna]|uniref:Uncharacterized protein n=1 Tax=Daphnia magna TaxID=35525 RepID=A0ABQ9YRE6_9CRUS|nr:hypothetical protein OUZ56_004974 [Daphnia magna]